MADKDQSSIEPMIMPSPPDFLLATIDNPPIDNPPRPVVSSDAVVHKPSTQPKTVEFAEWQKAVEDRRLAEVQYAQSYSQFIEVTELNEKLLKRVRRIDAFRRRVRRVYNTAKRGDLALIEKFKILTENLQIAEKSIEAIQIENEALLSAIQSYEEKETEVSQKLSSLQQEHEIAQAKLSETEKELQAKNEALQQASDKLESYLIQMEQIGASSAETTQKYIHAQDEISRIKDELLSAQTRETQLARLNSELADAMSKSQKRIKELEESVAADRLIEQARTWEKEKRAPNQSPLNRAEARNDRSEFYKKWTHIIDELSSHSASLKSMDQGLPKTDLLLSEQGDIG